MPTERPAWLPPDFIVLTETANPSYPVFVRPHAVTAVETCDDGSLVNVMGRDAPYGVAETPAEVFHAITLATR